MNILKYIHESNLIENIYDPDYDDQGLIAWEFLTNQPILSHWAIQKTQKIITTLQDDLAPHQRGYYRDRSQTNVFVAGRVCPPYSMVEGMMDNWLIDYQNLDPLDAHIRFEKIHPFADGNGRTGRMLMWWQEIKADKEPTLFKSSEKHDKYYPLFI